jgi:hypothetical protein
VAELRLLCEKGENSGLSLNELKDEFFQLLFNLKERNEIGDEAIREIVGKDMVQ